MPGSSRELAKEEEKKKRRRRRTTTPKKKKKRKPIQPRDCQARKQDRRHRPGKARKEIHPERGQEKSAEKAKRGLRQGSKRGRGRASTDTLLACAASSLRACSLLRHSARNQQGKASFPSGKRRLSRTMRHKRYYSLACVSAAWRGGDRRPAGAEAPTPPGRSSCAERETAGGRRPLPRGREEEGGLAEQIYRPSRMAALTRGWGS